ncbi:MAG: hypothetical protein IT370_34770 [Deltaproteobacteria bacterium]|nr:hypothetical protein [Deltaproteobacteria bacterium]
MSIRPALAALVVLPVFAAVVALGCASAGNSLPSLEPDAGKDNPITDAGTRDTSLTPEDLDSAVTLPIDAAVSLPVDAAMPDARTPDAQVVGADAALNCTPLPQTGAITVMGATTAASEKWLRPLATTCPATDYSSFGLDVPRAQHVFCNLGAASKNYDFAMEGTDEDAALTHPDPYIVIYTSVAIPANPLQCAAGNDDRAGGGTSIGALVSNFNLNSGVRINLVATGFGDTDFGTYRLRITAR